MSDNYFNPVFTDIGRTVAADDTGQGLQTMISFIALGDAKYAVRDTDGIALDVAASATTLLSERWRTKIEAGGSPSPGVLDLVAEITKAEADDPQFFISEVGFLNADGVLIALWSSDAVNIGYRGDVMSWYLSLGLAWVDLPGNMFTVEVLNAPLSQQMLGQARLRNQISDFVVESGLEYDDEDSGVLTRAIERHVNMSVRRPISIRPQNGAVDVSTTVTLVSSAFFSADGFQHSGSRFIVYDESGGIVLDSGEVGPVTQYEVSSDVLDTLSKFSWEVVYKGELGDRVNWSSVSERSYFETTGISAYNSAPTNISPSNNLKNVAVKPSLTVSGYNVFPAEYDTVDALQIRLYSDAGLTDLVWDSGVKTSNLTTAKVDISLPVSSKFYWVARQRGSILGWTEWSAPYSFTTSNIAVGAVMSDGGIVAGQYNGYVLIAAPASKRSSSIKFGLWKVDTSLVNLGKTDVDPNSGLENTDTLINNYGNVTDGRGSVGPEAALFCRQQGSDYFLPNKEELAAVIRNAEYIDDADKSSGIKLLSMTGAWSSSEYGDDTALYIRIPGATINYVDKSNFSGLIPVRRVPL